MKNLLQMDITKVRKPSLDRSEPWKKGKNLKIVKTDPKFARRPKRIPTPIIRFIKPISSVDRIKRKRIPLFR